MTGPSALHLEYGKKTTGTRGDFRYISWREPDWQLSSMEQVCNPLLHPLSTIEVLHIWNRYSSLVWKDDVIENTQWLQLLLPFTAVKELHVSKEFMPGIAATLKELVGNRIAEILPSLQNIHVEDVKQLRACTRTYYPYRLIPSFASNVSCRLALVLEMEPLTKTILHAHERAVRPWRGRRSRSLRNGSVR